MRVDDEQFRKYVAEAIDAIPHPFNSRIDNIAFLVEDDPTPEQRLKLHLYPNETLFGLYEGVPLPQRGGVTKLLPDKITVFKNPILAVFSEPKDIETQIHKTIWHEVAHFYGLDHKRIHQLERKHIT